MVEELPVESLLRFNGASDVVCVKFDPDSTFCTCLLDVDLLHLAEVGADQLDLVFDVDEETGFFLQVHFLQVEHVLEQNAVRRVRLGQLNWLGLFWCFGLWRSKITYIFITHELLHQLGTGGS